MMRLERFIAVVIFRTVVILCTVKNTESISDLELLRDCPECAIRVKKQMLVDVACVECFCDLECIIYGDCCIDLMIDFGLHTKHIDSGLNCVAPNSTDDVKIRTIEELGFYMRNFYLESGITKDFCDSRFLPVSCKDGISYVNMECAVMNQATDCVQWSLESECSIDDLLQPTCEHYHVPPTFVELRLCDVRRSYDIISNCSFYDERLIGLCEKYYSLVYGEDGRVYRNIFCFQCNRNGYGGILSEDTNPFISLTDFSDAFNKAVTPCDGQTAWMDMYAEKCRPIKCYSDKILEDGYCLSNNRTALGNKYQLLARLELSTRHPVPVMRQVIGLTMYRASAQLYTLDYNIEASVQVPKFNTSVLFLHIWLTISHDILMDEMENIFANLTISWKSLLATFDIIRHKLHYSEQTYKYLQSDQKAGLCCTDQEKSQISNELEYVPLTNELSCSYIEFDQSEFTVQTDVFIPHLNLTLSQENGEFSVFKDVLSVCFERFLLKTNLTRTNGTYYISNDNSSFDVILWYITIICISLSMLSLVLVIITYLVFSELRTQPGINNLILACNLFLAQLILMLGFDKTGQVTLCKTLVVITHFLWLSMLFWMNICSYHMFTVFVFMKLVVRASRVKQSVLYSIYGYGVPILIIATTIVANVIPTSGRHLGYGGHICYLSSQLLVLYSFVIPLCYVIVSNVIFFILTVIAIHRVKQEGKQTDRNNVYIYLKLSVVTGVFWTISLLSNVVDTIVLDYISVILNGSQGIFLLWSFVLNKSILNKLKEKYGQSVTSDSSVRTAVSSTKTPES